MKLRIGLLFGGTKDDMTSSYETMLQVAKELERESVKLVPIYVDLDGNWYTSNKFLSQDAYAHIDSWLKHVPPVRLQASGRHFRLVVEREYGIIYNKKSIDEVFVLLDNKRSDYTDIVNYLEYMHISYAGTSAKALHLLADQVHVKDILLAHRLSVLKWTWCMVSEVQDQQKEFIRKVKRLGFPLRLYPACQVSQYVKEVDTVQSLMDELVTLHMVDDKLILEKKAEGLVACQISAIIRGGMVDLTELQKEVDGKRIPYYTTEEANAQCKWMVRKAIKALSLDGIVKFELWYDKDKEIFYMHRIEPMPAYWEKEAFESIQLDGHALVNMMLQQAKMRAWQMEHR